MWFYVSKKMRKLGAPEERLFCHIEALFKQIMVYVAILKAGKTSIVEPNTKVNAKYYQNDLLKKMIPEMIRILKHARDILKHPTDLELTQASLPLKC